MEAFHIELTPWGELRECVISVISAWPRAKGTHRRNHTMIPMSSVLVPATVETGARQAPASSSAERAVKATRAKALALHAAGCIRGVRLSPAGWPEGRS